MMEQVPPDDFPPSLWAAVTPPRPPAAPLAGAVEADVAVIGAGFTGLAAALHLAKAGRAVTVLEAKAVGWGASGRNNGQVIPTLSAAEPDALIARHGEAGERFARLVGGSAGYLFDLVREEGIVAEAEQTGWFQPAHSPGRTRVSRQRVEAWRRLGFPAEYLDADQAEALVGSSLWHGGMYNPTGGHINPLALARGLAAAAERRGAVLHESSPATGFRRDGAQWVTTTPQGALKSRALILATNAYTGEIAPGLAPRLARSIVPVAAWQMATPPIGDNLRSRIVPGRQAVSDTRGDLRFFRYDARNRLITGAAVIAPWNAAERVRAEAARRLELAFPELGRQEMTHVWKGWLGMTRDRFPRVHRLGPDGWAWIACNGRGVALSVALGRDLALAAAGVDEGDLALPVSEPRPIRFQPVLRRLAPGYLAWLRRKDRLEPAG